MKIYPKILLVTLPLLVLGLLAMGILTYALTRTAMDGLADKWLSTKLSEAMRMARENQDVLVRFGLETITPNVEKAQEDTAREFLDIAVGETGLVMAVDSQGRIVAHPDARFLGLSVAFTPWFRSIRHMQSGRVEPSLDGRPQFGVFARFEPWDWIIIVSAPRREVFREAMGLKTYFWAVGGIVLLAAALLLMVLARRLTKPVYVLAREAERIGAGDLETPVTCVSNDELGQLAGSIQEMQARLKGLYDRQENTIRERTRDLARKAEELEGANLRLRELDEMKSSFLSSVSHELRTPLTSVLGFARLIDKDFATAFQVLGRGNPPLERKAKRIRGNLGIIVNEGERLTRLINDFLDLAKIESGKLEWHDRLLDMDAIVHRAVEATSNRFAEKPQVGLFVEAAQGLPSLVADPDRLTQVVVNLLDNAAKFTDQGRVDVSLGTGERGVIELHIKDTGQGIPEEELELIFDKFHQLRPKDTINRKPPGTGLGLAICKQIVEHYRGVIRVVAQPGQGAEFIVTLPSLDVTATASEAEILALRASDKEIVMVVDDDPGIRSLLTQMMERAGFGVLAVGNGEAAVAMLDKVRPDLITMDILMPGMDGREAMTAIRNRPEMRGIPILVISVLQGGRVGVEDAFLTKPVDEDMLLSTIRSLLGRGEANGPMLAVRVNGPYEFDRYFTLCGGCIEQVREPELWRRIGEGFQGTVILSAGAAAELDLGRLRNLEKVHVLILPETNRS